VQVAVASAPSLLIVNRWGSDGEHECSVDSLAIGTTRAERFFAHGVPASSRVVLVNYTTGTYAVIEPDCTVRAAGRFVEQGTAGRGEPREWIGMLGDERALLLSAPRERRPLDDGRIVSVHDALLMRTDGSATVVRSDIVRSIASPPSSRSKLETPASTATARSVRATTVAHSTGFTTWDPVAAVLRFFDDTGSELARVSIPRAARDSGGDDSAGADHRGGSTVQLLSAGSMVYARLVADDPEPQRWHAFSTSGAWRCAVTLPRSTSLISAADSTLLIESPDASPEHRSLAVRVAPRCARAKSSAAKSLGATP
jgi:hypothetical protein